MSPLTKSIFDAFESARGDARAAALLVFWEPWGGGVFYRAVEKGKYPWAVYDDFKKAQPHAVLCFAFDTARGFDEQFPMKSYAELETLECFAQTPIIWIADRSGTVPAQERRKFERRALATDLKLIPGGKIS